MIVSLIKVPCFCGGVSSFYRLFILFLMSSTEVVKCCYEFFSFNLCFRLSYEFLQTRIWEEDNLNLDVQ